MRISIVGLWLLMFLASAWADDSPKSAPKSEPKDVAGGGRKKAVWTVARPKSSPHGESRTLRVTLDEAHSHRGEIQNRQVSKMAQGGITVELEFLTYIRVLDTPEPGRIRVGGDIKITKLALDGDEITERVQAAVASAYVTGLVRDRRVVNGGRVIGAEALRQLGKMFVGLPALVIPYLPKQAVRVGEVWNLPPQYVLWNVGQPMAGKPVGESFQVFEALEERAGVPCARIRTAVAVRTELSKGAAMLPPGPAVSQVVIEMRHWLGLDGYLRAAQTTARMLVTHTESKRTLAWEMTRSVKAGPAPVPSTPLGKNWAPLLGKIPFVRGYEAGMKEARFTGRAPMFFVTSCSSAAGRVLGKIAFSDEKICKLLAGYTPILIDAETEEAFMKSRGKGNLLMDPTLIWEDLDGDTVFTMVGGLPDVFGVDLSEIAVTMFEIPARRTPTPQPGEAYQELVQLLDQLRAAQKGEDRKAAVRTILAIQGVGLGRAIQEEAAAAEQELTTYADGQLDQAATLLGDKKTRAQGRTLLEALAAVFAGHPLAKRVQELLESGGRPSQK